MNSLQFSELLKNPGSADAMSLASLEDIVRRYPYCQSGHLLFTFNLFRENDPNYPSQLKKAAAYAGDRKVLKALIESGKFKGPLINPPYRELQNSLAPPVPPSEPEAVGPHPSPTDGKAAFLPIPPGETATSNSVAWELASGPSEEEMASRIASSGVQERMTQEELLAIVKKRLAEINDEKHPGQAATQSPPAAAMTTSRKAIIDKFILEEPRISKPKTSFFSPAESALRSNLDEEEIVSETLARLYAQQGNVQKAIHIYEKLSLLNQEKSRYFAAQIKNLGSGT